MRDFIEKGQSVHLPADLNDVVEEALGLALVGARIANVKVRRHFQKDMRPVSIDKIQIQQVVLNLVRNAIEAMEGGTLAELTITTFAKGQGSVTVSVADTGPGLAPEVKEKLFSPFTTTKETGMGIGLSVCRSIIEAHKGKIWAEETESGGARFSFLLPTREGMSEHDGA